jgi:hypothetical protein
MKLVRAVPPRMRQHCPRVRWPDAFPVSPYGRYSAGVPGSAKSVVRVDVATQDVSEIGQNLKGPYIETTYPKNQFKWLRGARGADGAIYGVPSNANKVLRISPETGVCDTIGGAGE